jgi:hypothetical protein
LNQVLRNQSRGGFWPLVSGLSTVSHGVRCLQNRNRGAFAAAEQQDLEGVAVCVCFVLFPDSLLHSRVELIALSGIPWGRRRCSTAK